MFFLNSINPRFIENIVCFAKVHKKSVTPYSLGFLMKKIIRICRAGIICVGSCKLSMRKTHAKTGEYGLMMTKNI